MTDRQYGPRDGAPATPAYTLAPPKSQRTVPPQLRAGEVYATPRKWLNDRIRGQSKYNDRERPPGPCCWVPPVVGWCPGLMETNCLCKLFGRMGISKSESFRFVVLHLGITANIFALIATSYAALSISLEYFLLSKSFMEVVEAKELTGRIVDPVYLYLGLRGIAVDNPAYATSPIGRQIVIGYDDVCDLTPGSLYFDSTSKDCASCSSDYFSMNAVISLMVSVPLFFPTFFYQQLRMYSGYDVNCAKNLLSLLGICIVLLNMNVMLTYFYLCSKESIYEQEIVYFDQNQTPFVSEAEAYYAMEYTWSWGWGLIALIAGTGLKVIDLLCNIAVPTPRVTHDANEQEIYETIVYVDPEEAPTDDDN